MESGWFIHGAVIFALVVVVPMGLVLSDRLQGRSRVPLWVPVGTGALASASFFVPKGLGAALMCVPWVVACVAAGADKLGNLRTLVARVVFLLPHAYLVFGAGWLVVSRYGGRPLGFPAVIVELTAVHFHYAGFVAPVIVAVTRNDRARARGPLMFALCLSIVASPLTAIGFVYSATIGALGAMAFAVGLGTWSLVTLTVVVPRVRGDARIPLTVAGGTVLVSMTLAVIYAVGVAAGESWISISTMARTHGFLNAVGFGFCGAGGWLIATRATSPGRGVGISVGAPR